MHSLLKRQIRKYLPEDFKDSQDLAVFLDAIEKSYSNYDEKVIMVQRAMNISSEELFEANKYLTAETENQKKTLNTLEKAIELLNNTSSEGDQNKKFEIKSNLDPLELVSKIENQANDIVRMTSEKNKMLKDLERQNAALNDYAHMVSHDLKSPIRNVNALLNWIIEDENKNLSETSVKNCELISENIEKMDALIDGILKHAVLDSLDEKVIELDLNVLIEDIKKIVYYPETISIEVNGKLPIIISEKYKIEQLFTNLITNAITATEHIDKGRIVIESFDKGDFWEFSVNDNGKGIAERHQKSIFDMFKKLENNSRATGIGLALVKKVVNIYQGNIWLKSEENKGTTFYFTLKKQP
ncbi:HAMP domain-containing histidine kinase [Cellulophaga sp. HaHaR_3_176]|uniref:sensor histidine kinase n=1 Tax=Cellulophaga sp. HaHaR_3_176 TaxID=1942464 RepID=UPI001C1FDC98|nr:HAMP domain-containing sensor histidine kinase [Cellulophaga sp. HaHaR_3_176]QWX84754.1 HAMP domain-containing histidine kinase [Cellulophaga sp. HaHaR_3_176]